MQSDPGPAADPSRPCTVHEADFSGRRGTVCSLLTADPYDDKVVDPWTSIGEVLRRLNHPPRVGALVVAAERGRILGTVCGADILAGLTRYGRDVLDMAAENVMSRSTAVCSPQDDLDTVLQAMTATGHHHLPVLSHGELLGVISILDVARARLRETQAEVTGPLDDMATGA